jgi:enamine deaminase RidA (YjgF/YER057c/UK114 family)
MMSSRFLATGARSLQKCALPGRRFNEKVAVCCFGSIARIGTDDPKMSQAVVHNGIVYISGQIDMTVDDSTF